MNSFVNILDGSVQNILAGGKKLQNSKTKRSGGSQLMNKPDYVEHLSEPWFSLISLGLKTVEGRKNKGKFKDMEVGKIIQWFNDDFEHRSINTRIISKQTYSTFEEYLVSEGLDKCLPGIPSISHGLSVYFKYFTKEDESTYGVVAIRLELIK